MSSETRHECLEKARPRYQGAGRKYKKIILDEFCATWGYNRKYAIDLLNGKTVKGGGRRRRPTRYGEKEHTVLERMPEAHGIRASQRSSENPPDRQVLQYEPLQTKKTD